MTTFSIGQKVSYTAQAAEVLSLEAGKRGRTLATIRLESGRVLKTDTRFIETLPEFAPAESWDKIVREGKAEDRRRALRNIGEG